MADHNSAYQVRPEDFTGNAYRPNRILQDVNGRLASLEREVTGSSALACQVASASAALTLTGSPVDIPGAGLILGGAGTYLVTANVDFNMAGAGDQGVGLFVLLTVDGARLLAFLVISVPTANARSMASQQWLVQASKDGQHLQLQGYKNAGTGATAIDTNTTLSALRVA